MDRVTLTLNGDVSVDLFAEAITGLSNLLTTLTEEIAADSTIDWQVVDLNAGSATAVVQGIAEIIEDIEKVVSAYSVIGENLAAGKPIPYSPRVEQAVSSITAVLNGKISSIEFGADSKFYCITEPYQKEKIIARAYAYGSITGKVENLIGHKTLKFTLYDNLFNKGVTCRVEGEKRELLRDIWGKNVTVIGYIYRDMITGRPLEIHDIQSIDVIQTPEPGAYKKARGILPWRLGDETAEQTIRRIRDDEYS